MVSLSFNGDGTKAFGAMTTRITGNTAPANQAAIVLDGLVVSSPRIIEAINKTDFDKFFISLVGLLIITANKTKYILIL